MPKGRARDNAGNTALHYAGGADMAQSLLSNGSDVNAKSRSGSTPLHYAAGQGHADVVQLLIDNHAAIDSRDARSQTPGAWAMQAGRKEIVRLLAARGATPMLPMAAYAGDAPTVHRLLEAGANVNQQDDEGCTPLFLAAQEGNIEVMELLIARGADVNRGRGRGSQKFTPLHVASSATPLHEATRGGHRDAVAALVAAGAEINKLDDNGCTPLREAVLQGRADVVEFLLEKGADATMGRMGRDLALPDPRPQTVADILPDDLLRRVLQDASPERILYGRGRRQ